MLFLPRRPLAGHSAMLAFVSLVLLILWGHSFLQPARGTAISPHLPDQGYEARQDAADEQAVVDVGGGADPPPSGQSIARPEGEEVLPDSSDRLEFQPACPDYSMYAFGVHEPATGGRFNLPFQRPKPACRRFRASEVEETIASMKSVIQDPDLFRLFENCFPNTLDTAIAWRGLAGAGAGVGAGIGAGVGVDRAKSAKRAEMAEVAEMAAREELTFITTGDINAMWLRDSANQLQSYRTLLRPNASHDSLAALFRGAINLQSRYLQQSPYCNAFLAPAESRLPSSYNAFGSSDFVQPMPDGNIVFECKYELDSLAAFLQLSHDYYAGTGDAAFFGRHGWVAAVESLLATATELLAGTFDENGHMQRSPYKFQRMTNTASETLANSGSGNPVASNTGMVRSAFRPSDDACTYQLFVPANMMFSRYLEACVPIMEGLAKLDKQKKKQRQKQKQAEGEQRQESHDYAGLAQKMASMAASIRKGIEKHGRVKHAVFGTMYAYEVDGFGSHNLMDDANIPSLLSAAMFGYVDRRDTVYQNTRRFVLSKFNPYYVQGSAITGTGGPHVGLNMAWPMSLIVKIMTEDSDSEIVASLQQLISTTGGLGLMHESISGDDSLVWTRQWFSWANGLFGQMILDLYKRKPHLLATSFQSTF